MRRFLPALTLLATEPSAAMAAEGLAVIAMFLLMGNLAHIGHITALAVLTFERV